MEKTGIINNLFIYLFLLPVGEPTSLIMKGAYILDNENGNGQVKNNRYRTCYNNPNLRIRIGIIPFFHSFKSNLYVYKKQG